MPLADLQFKMLSKLPEGISKLAELAQAEGFRFIDRLINDFQTGNNTFSGVGEVFIAVFEETHLVGVGGLNQDPYSNCENTGRVRRLYVHPDYRGYGVGKEILKLIEQEASANFTKLNLFTDSTRAAKFYEKQGYTSIQGEHISHFKQVGALLLRNKITRNSD